MLATSTTLLASMMLAIPTMVSAMHIVPGRPAPGFLPRTGHNFAPKLTGCGLSKAVLPLPAGAAAANVSIPAGETVEFVALGVGVQNYTCTAGVYGSNMAVATLYDASCAVGTPLYTQLTSLAVQAAPKVASLPAPIQSLIGQTKLGNHYFQKLSATATSASPVFDFQATKKGDYIAAAKVGTLASPKGAGNVAWLELKNVQGSLASHVFRVETTGGAPSSCNTEGQVLTVNYSALYWFYK